MAEENKNVVVNAEPVKKKERIPAYKQRTFNYNFDDRDDTKFHYHFARGYPANLERYFQGGYDQVFGKDKKPITRRGKSEEEYDYLLRIPLELYLDDTEGKLAEPREIDESLGKKGVAKTAIPGLSQDFTYGGVKTFDQVGRNISEEKIKR